MTVVARGVVQRLPLWAVAMGLGSWVVILQAYGTVLAVPTFLSGVLLLGFLAPSMVAAAVLASAQSSSALVEEALSPRPMGAVDRLWAPLLTVAAAGGWLVVAWGGFMAVSEAVVAARNLVGFVGVGLLVRGFAPGAVSTAAPVYTAVLAAVLGGPSVPALAWVNAGPGEVWASAVAMGLAAAGWAVGTGRGALRRSALALEGD